MKFPMPALTRRGFTLIEISVVLVIIGLLVGAVLAGRDLIRAAELRGIISEVETYKTAVNTFNIKYNAIPGDMADARTIWGGKADCTDRTEFTSTCKGSNDGRITASTSIPSWGNEIFLFWQHLANAGLISGKFNGVEGTISQFAGVPGTNSPGSKMTDACWGVMNQNFSNGSDTSTFYIDLGNFFAVGNPTISSWVGDNSILTPREAYNIDNKIDDGMPGTGKFTMRRWATCTTASSGTDFTANYNLTNTSIVCKPQFIKAF